jgi:ABC-type Fe3+/spermidine/putrescine transport system ATPase subunit
VKTPIISVQNLTKQYLSGVNAGIRDITFDIYPGEIFAIIGESGSGKSTLLKCLYGLEQADSGDAFLEGVHIKGPHEQLIPGHKQMKMVTQDFSLNIYAKVYDNIASVLSNTNLDEKQNRTEAIMEHLRISALRNKRIVELSGGEQQRVAIARALVSDTKVLLLDEPFSQVDAILKNQLRRDVKLLAKETGLTIILVSHDASDGLFLADRMVILREGQQLQVGAPKEIYHQPNSFYTAKLLGNAVVLSQAAASRIGFVSFKSHICFYPEWVHLDKASANNSFLVKDVYFKGFYEELLLEKEGISIRAIQFGENRFQKNDQVSVRLDRFLEY